MEAALAVAARELAAWRCARDSTFARHPAELLITPSTTTRRLGAGEAVEGGTIGDGQLWALGRQVGHVLHAA